MPNLARKNDERFKPSIFERLKQSVKDKARKGRRLHVVDTETLPPAPTTVPTSTPILNTGPILTNAAWDIGTTGLIKQHQVWKIWTDTSNINSATTAWSRWNCNHLETKTASGYDPWHQWITNIKFQTTNSATTWENWNNQWIPGAVTLGHRWPTPEEQKRQDEELAKVRAETEARLARFREQERETARKRKEADDRAMVLLMSCLDEQQKADMKRYQHFFVEAPSGRLYRIDYGTHGNVKVVDRMTRKVIERLCIQPNGVPAGDANLMQKLLIETAEDTFRSHANITLEDGRIVHGLTTLLDNTKLAKVIPLRKAA